MSDIVYKLNEKEFRFKPVKGRKLLKFTGFLAQIVGGDLMGIIQKGGLDKEISKDAISGMVKNLTEDNIDKLLDNYFRKFILVPNLTEDKNAEEFFDSLEIQDLMQLVINFVMMAFTGAFPETAEIQKKS